MIWNETQPPALAAMKVFWHCQTCSKPAKISMLLYFVYQQARKLEGRMDALSPSLFIGSSSEGLPVARALQAELDDVCEPVVWSQGVFEPTGTTIGSLLEQAQNSDFAALVVTPDDSVVTRGSEISAARDNVIFELGLFLGALGPLRVFVIHTNDQDLRLPSDLAGVTCLKYRRNRGDQNLQAAIGPAANAIRNRIDRERISGRRGRPQSIAPTGHLTRPRGGRVNRQDTVTGLVAFLPPGSEALILVQTPRQPLYWPQAKLLLNEQGGFTSEAKFGRVGSQDSGEEFILMLVLAPSAAAASFQASLETDDGMSSLPPDVLVLDQVTVIRH